MKFFRLGFKFIAIPLFLFLFVLFVPKSVMAACTNGPSQGPSSNPPPESCINDSWGGSHGNTVYNCAEYLGYGYSCYYHSWSCSTPCGGANIPTECSKECRKTSCGGGYKDAAGCGKITPTTPNSGCKVNQACCQATSCGGSPSCTASSPGVTPLLNPSDGLLTSNTSVTLEWGSPTWGNKCPQPNVNKFKVYMNTCSSTGTPVAPTTLVEELLSTIFSKNYTRSPGTYCWRIGATNGQNETSSLTRRFTINQDQISGRVYFDANNTCSTSTAVPWNQPQQVYVTIPGVNTVAIPNSGATAGQYAINAAPGTARSVSVVSYAPYICSTACTGACTKTSVYSPASNQNFFLTTSRGAWWQAVAGGVYAGDEGTAVTVKSELPPGKELIIPGTGAVAALVQASTGDTSVGSGQLSSTGWRAVSSYTGEKMDYAFFASHMGVTSATENDWTGPDLTVVNPIVTTKDFYYLKPAGGTATLTNAWSLTDANKIVVFVDGNLNINNNITVGNAGAFAAFIVNGDVVVAPNVTQLQGLYVMDGAFTSSSRVTTDDSQLQVQGTVAAWGGVNFNRSLGGSDNWNLPAESFTYRPDLLSSMPDKMKMFALRWQEVAPGSFGQLP